MRKFTLFLSFVFAFLTANAQEVTVTSLDQLNNEKTYFIESARCFLMYNTTANANGISTSTAKNLGTSTVAKDWTDVNQLFKIEQIDGSYYLYSVGAAKYVTKNGGFSDTATDALGLTATQDATYNWLLTIGGNGMNSQEPGQMDAGIIVNGWTTEDPGNRYKIIDAEASTVVVIDYPNEFSEFDQNKCYTVTTTSRGGWAVANDVFCSTNDAGLGTTSNASDVNQQFAVLSNDGENYYLYSVGAKKFVKSDKSLIAGRGEAIELADASSVGECRVRVNFKGYTNKYINLGGGKQMIIDDWSAVDAGNAVAFIEAGDFDPTEALEMLNNVATITYQFKYEGTVVATQEAIAVPGGEYPDYTLQAPYGVTGAAKPSGTVSGDETVVIELSIEKVLPFEAVTSGEPAKWYYAQIHGNNLSYMTNPGIGAEMPWKVNNELITAVDEANADSYTWGFVGNLWTGFKVVSKAGGAIKSTGSGNVTIVENIDDATAFIAMAPQTGNNDAAESGFCLLNAEAGQYINAQNVGVNHWSANDAGSTIVVTEREFTVEPEALVPTSIVRTNKTVEYKLAGVQLSFDEKVTATTPENGEYGYVLNANDEKVLVFDKMSGGTGTGKFATFQNSVYGTAVEIPGEYKVVITTVLTGESGKVYSGGEYAFTVTKHPVEVSRDVEFWGNTVEEMPFGINITINYADEITLDETKKVTLVNGETTYEAVVTLVDNVINIAFDENTEFPEGTYTFNIPAGLYTVNGEANEAVTEEFTFKKAVPVKIVSVYPEAGTVESIEFITIEFNQALNVADMCNYEIYFNGYYLIQEESFGETTSVSYYVSGADADGYATYEATTITAPGEYTLNASDIAFFDWAEDQQESYTWTIAEATAPFEVVAVTPSEPVAELSTITVEFSEEIAGTQDVMAMETIYVGSKTNACNFTVEGKVLTITLWTPITTPGEYALKVPAGVGITRVSNGEAVSIDGEITFTVEEPIVEPEEPAFDWAGTYVFTGEPTSKDGSEYPAKFEVEVTFYEADEYQDAMYCVTSFMGNDVIDINYGGIELAIAEDGKSATLDNGNVHSLGGGSFLKLFAADGTATPIAITLNEDGTLTMADFTVVMGAWGDNENNTLMAEYKNNTLVKGEIVEPEEPETPTGLNETAIFDFTNNAWAIPTMEESNYSGVKTAGEYTDGVKTINIDPTANGGNFYYDNNGFLRIAKPGSKITLPAFGFAVEKIEVVGHSSATNYANVDMNVYVGETAVSTACTGSTETYTYEIAEGNQAAGNVYELVIGSNGCNYSSVMYITYIKVYPAENKLEAPAIDLASGVYVGTQTVNVHSTTADIEGVTDVTYYYTTNGNEPTVEDEEAVNGEITITESCTLKVVVELTYGDKTYVSASSEAKYIITEEVTYHRAVAVESGSYFIAADGNIATPLANGVLPAVETTINGNDLTEAAYYAITLEETAEGGTYYIKDVNGNYIYTSSMYGTSGPKLSSNGAYTPMSSWTITIDKDENSTATIVSEGLTLVYDTVAGVFKVTESVSGDMVLPTLYGTQATCIENVITNGEAIESIYDLNGRKIEEITQPGIYIVNGKKVFVK